MNDFYREVFDAEILRDGSEFPEGKGPRLSIIKIGDWAELNVFQIDGNTEADRQTPMFGRGRLDHLAVQAASVDAFETIRERLMARGGRRLRHRLRPDAQRLLPGPRRPRVRGVRRESRPLPGLHNPPGTRAARYS